LHWLVVIKAIQKLYTTLINNTKSTHNTLTIHKAFVLLISVVSIRIFLLLRASLKLITRWKSLWQGGW